MNRLRYFIVLFVLFFFGMARQNAIYAQTEGQAYIDSLLREFPKAKEDTGKVNLLSELSYTYSTINPDSGIKYGQKGLDLAEQLDWPKGIAMLNGVLGTNYCFGKSDFPSALTCYLKALGIYEETGNKKGISTTLGNIGSVYVYQSNYPQALEYYFKALKIREELGDKKSLANVLRNIGSVYEYQKNHTKALEYYFRALKIIEGLGNKANIGLTLANIGLIYITMKDYAAALTYEMEALKIAKETDSKDDIASTTSNIGMIYGNRKEYAKALPYYFSASRAFEEMDQKSSMGPNFGNIGECYLAIAKDTTGTVEPDSLIPEGKAANLKKAITYMTRGMALTKEVSDLNNLQEISQKLSEAQALTGNFKEALESYKQFIVVKDSVFNSDNNVKISNLETKRELDLKDKQIEIDRLAVAKKRNERGFYIAGIGVMIFVIAIIYRNFKTQKSINWRLASEKQKSETLLLNILPAEVADELKEKGFANARQFDDVTVLFTDFVNFTVVAERMAPRQLVGELHACFKAFDGIMGRYNIEKIKTVGDAYLAVSGLPVGNSGHAAEIVAAAIEIRNYMLQRKKQHGADTFDIRIGINSGSVVAGIVGVKKFAYDIWGDTVNLAARLEQNSEPGKINISETTYGFVKDKYNCVYRGKIEAKNKGEIDMYFVEDIV